MTDLQAKEATLSFLYRYDFKVFADKITALVGAGLTPVVVMGRNRRARTCGYPRVNTLLEAWQVWKDCLREDTTAVLVGTQRTW